MAELIPVATVEDILPQYRNTPVERLLRYHNLREPQPPTTIRAEILIGTCIDHREELIVPNEFAYVIRTAGSNLRNHEFQISYVIAAAGVTTLALLSHTDCGMSHVTQKREAFISGLVERGGCTLEEAIQQFEEYAPIYEIGDPVAFVLTETVRIRRLYPKILVTPLLYRVEDDKLAQILE
ncbi:MAG: carbonic anhydrase [Chloroflexota bacterium]|nr:carbonic anhydrase [Chloroflexota bacterium]